MKIIAESTSRANIKAPFDEINLTEWLFSLKNHEYQACSSSHIASGISFNENGKRVSINVELIAGNLLVQHYQEDISKPSHCRVNSISDSISGLGNTKLGITWELVLHRLTASTCELENHVVVSFTDQFLELLKKAGITDLEAVKAGMAENLAAHNLEETPLFAIDIEKKARLGLWV
ncbi:hypothetical protein EZ428_17950 [Pedobacter frigiditerrae]|uniref:Uncharacterized protein n=1 Tax=Pedobacter frigiditerrae TaxID=2530452 RepID=A0A4R0MNZ9_9SPHI|nr:hypothetical protein [Pedobacter frigiditerrae]TCC88525.1 hypothetical protein EZ428_17950 [Pedobacter frigiditerrae]